MGDGNESEGPFATTEPHNEAWPSLFILISRVMYNQHTKTILSAQFAHGAVESQRRILGRLTESWKTGPDRHSAQLDERGGERGA